MLSRCAVLLHFPRPHTQPCTNMPRRLHRLGPHSPANPSPCAGLNLVRMQALRSPVGIFAASPGANVVVQNSVNNQQVGW